MLQSYPIHKYLIAISSPQLTPSSFSICIDFHLFSYTPQQKRTTITFRSSSDSPHTTKVICIQEAKQSPLSTYL